MKLLILTLILVFMPESSSADKWDKEDETLAAIFTAAALADWGQTRDIVKNRKDKHTTNKDGSTYHEKGYYEKTNLILGKNPSMDKVNTYMPLATAATLAAAHYLPKKYRKPLLYGASLLELMTIYNNNKIGLRINF
jgi:hypothetical protein